MPNLEDYVNDPTLLEDKQDTEPVQPVEPVKEDVKVKPLAEPVKEEPKEPEPTKPEPTDNSIEIDGIGKVTLDEIKEWKQGYLRQSDYTRKTQHIASKERELSEAVQVYEWLKANPHIARRLTETDDDNVEPQAQRVAQTIDPLYQKIASLESQYASDRLDREISRLKGIYPDFNEVQVLNESMRLGIPDLEFVHRALRANAPQSHEQPVTPQKSQEQIEKEIREKILAELKQNALNTTTIIGGNDVPPTQTINITPEEKRIADAFGMTVDEYVKWREESN